MIKEFQTVADYEGSVPSSQQTDVALVTSTNEVHVNGVNVVVPVPEVGDVVYLDERNKIVFVNGGSVQKERIPGVWTHVGYVYRVLGNKIGIIDKVMYNEPFQQVRAYKLYGTGGIYSILFGNSAAPAETKLLYPTATSDVTQYATNVNVAIAADTDLTGWHAYADETDNSVVLMCATGNVWEFQRISDPGSSYEKMYDYFPDFKIHEMLVVWENGVLSDLELNCNLDRCVDYYSNNGQEWNYQEDISVPMFQIVVKESVFYENEHLAPARKYFGTYRNYIAATIIRKEQSTKSFTYPFVDYSRQFAEIVADVDGGGQLYVFPAIARCNQVAYDNDLLAAGKWHLPDFRDLLYIADDDTINALGAASEKVGTSTFDKNIDRWSLKRGGLYKGADGMVSINRSLITVAVAQAVTDIEI